MTAGDYLQIALAIAYAVIIIAVAVVLVAGGVWAVWRAIKFIRSL